MSTGNALFVSEYTKYTNCKLGCDTNTGECRTYNGSVEELPKEGDKCDDSFKTYCIRGGYGRHVAIYCSNGIIKEDYCFGDEKCILTTDYSQYVCYDEDHKLKYKCDHLGDNKYTCYDKSIYTDTCSEFIDGNKYFVTTNIEECPLGCNETEDACIPFTDDGKTCNDFGKASCTDSCAIVDGKIACYSRKCDKAADIYKCNGNSSIHSQCILADDGETIIDRSSEEWCDTTCDNDTGKCLIASDDGKTCNEKTTKWCKDSAANENHTAEETSCAILHGRARCYTPEDKCSNQGDTKNVCSNDYDSMTYTCTTYDDSITNLWVYYISNWDYCDSGCNQATGKCN